MWSSDIVLAKTRGEILERTGTGLHNPEIILAAHANDIVFATARVVLIKTMNRMKGTVVTEGGSCLLAVSN